LLLSLSCLLRFNSFLFFLNSFHLGFLESDPEGLKIHSPFSSPSWSFLFFANFSDCCLLLNCLTPAFPGLKFPFTNFLEMDLGFPSSSPL
ncbi:hypothetical protein N308_15053, partial [Struthio camelus australis]